MRRALSLCACGARLQQQLHGQQHRRVRLLHATRAALADARKDPYGVLGVPKDSGKEDVKKAYYKLVKKCVARAAAAAAAGGAVGGGADGRREAKGFFRISHTQNESRSRARHVGTTPT